MYARMTRLTQSPDRLEETISTFEPTVVEVARRQPGYVGTGLAADRKEGTAIAFTLWDTQEAMNASEQTATALRTKVADEQGVEILGVERFEVVHMEGTYTAGTCARVTSLQVPPERVEELEREFRDRIVPLLRAERGFCRAAAYVNRQTGSVVVATGWQTADDREASEPSVAPLRSELTERLGASSPVRIELYDLVFADVPVQATIETSAQG
jgi:heme-degrading monooxygenase HmoA